MNTHVGPPNAADLKCPHCKSQLQPVPLGNVVLAGCASCRGLWVNADLFKRISEGRDLGQSLLGRAIELSKAPPPPLTVKYVKCPVCLELMNRKKFSNCSTVIIDVCVLHGTWLDAHELEMIVAFTQSGGAETIKKSEAARRAAAIEKYRESVVGKPILGTPEKAVSDLDWLVLGEAGEAVAYVVVGLVDAAGNS